MNISDYILLISACLVAIGWFVTGYLNRKNEIAIKRFEYRMRTLQLFLDVFFYIQKNGTQWDNPDFLNLLSSCRGNINIYGEDDEIRLFEKIVSCFENGNTEEAKELLNKMVLLVRTRTRVLLDIN